MVSDRSAPDAPYIAVDRDGWVYGFETSDQIAGELENLDIANGEYVVYDRFARHVEVSFRGREVDRRLEGQESYWPDLQRAVHAFLAKQNPVASKAPGPETVSGMVKSLRRL